MGRITLSESARSELAGVMEPVELCDPSGKILGRYIPESEDERLCREGRQLFDLAEVDRRMATGKFLSSEEVERRMNDRGQGQ